MTQLEGAREIYLGIAKHVEYDVAFRYVTDPREVARTGRAACEGFAALFMARARTAGLEARRLPGFARGRGYAVGSSDTTANHVWNAVRADGSWHLLDVTFARQGDFFAVPPRQFIYTHLPLDPAWQLLSEPVAASAHARLPCLLPAAHRYSVYPESHRECIVECGGECTLQFRLPASVGLEADLEGHPGCVLCERGQVHVRVPAPGAYHLRVAAGPRSEPGLDDAVYYRVRATEGRAEAFPQTWLGFRRRRAVLHGPRQGRLRAGELVEFQVEAPGTRRLVLHAGGKCRELAGVDGRFQGTWRPPAGELVLAADEGEALCQWWCA